MKERIKSLIYIIVGNILIAFSVSTLILENNIIAGGVTGIGLIFSYFTNASVTTIVYITNITLFLLALFFVGKKFALTALLSTFLFPALLDVFQRLDILHHYCKDIFLASILAGSLVGIGIGLVLKANASTGGIDIIAIILNKKFDIPVYITINIIDLCNLTLQMMFSNITNLFYGFIVVFLTSFMLNKTLTSGKKMITSNSYQ